VLAIYLNDHLAGSTGALELVRRSDGLEAERLHAVAEAFVEGE
jgi:hypothetical protein